MFISWIFNSLAFKIVFLVLVILFFVFICIKTDWGKVVTAVICNIALVAFTIFCGINIEKHYSAEGGTFGFIKSQFAKPEVTVVQTVKSVDFDFSNIVMSKIYEDQNYYSLTLKSDKKFVLESDKEYVISVNGTPVDVQRFNNSITAKFTNVFFGDDNKAKFEDTMTIDFLFYSNYTDVKISIESGLKGYGYWTDYFGKENLNVHVESSETLYVSPDITDQFDFCVVNLKVNNTTKSFLVPFGSDYTLPTPELESNCEFVGWKDSEGNYVTEVKNIENSVTFTADYINKNSEYVVKFYIEQPTGTFGSEWVLTETQKYHYGEKITYKPSSDVMSNFGGWYDSKNCGLSGDGNLVEICTGNISLYAGKTRSSGGDIAC